MLENCSRRNMLKLAGAAAITPALTGCAPGENVPESTVETLPKSTEWPPVVGPDVPKICWPLSSDPDESQIRRLQQLGITHTMGRGGRIPWDETMLRDQIERHWRHGFTLGIIMMGGFPNTIYGRPGRDEEIDNVIKTIQAAGRAGLPVIEYNFYANRLMEGYIEEIGRGGAGYTAYDYKLSKDLPPKPEIGAHSMDEMWDNITYFLKAVIPEAEKAGVRLALHPNDPPVPLSRGSEQIMGTLAGWKKLVDIVPSPSNGITYDCGVTREMGEDAVEVCRYFGERDCINHAHYRNVRVRIPSIDYTEVFLDEGQADMFNVMRELVRQKYPRLVYPEHTRAFDLDREQPGFRSSYPGGGGYVGSVFNVAYTRAMLQAALSE